MVLDRSDILQEYANTKTLGLWRGDCLHVSFAKCGATLTKCRHHRRRRKKLNLPSKVLNTNKSNENVHFYHRGQRPWLKYLDAESGQASTSAAVKSCDRYMSRGTKLDRRVQQKNLFVDGCTSLRIESIKIHETSANHVKATAIIAAK